MEGLPIYMIPMKVEKYTFKNATNIYHMFV